MAVRPAREPGQASRRLISAVGFHRRSGGIRARARPRGFVARPDGRTPLPIANDPAFHHGLFQLALEEPWIETGEDRQLLPFDGLDALGLADPVLCDVPKRLFADFLASATARLLPRHLSSTVRPPMPSLASQLALDFLTA